MPRTRPTQFNQYQRVLIDFMSYKDATQYEEDHTFTDVELGQITPEHLQQWMCFKAYGTAEPGPDDNPTHARSTSLKYYKKAISYFMPNGNYSWNVFSNDGNPTKSKAVNDVIKAVLTKEVRKQGKASSARRALEMAEFEQSIDLIEAFPDADKKYAISAVSRFQTSMIARIDDTCKFKLEDLKPDPQFAFTLLAQMCWSKNVRDERDAPNQILLGAMDMRYCVLVGLAVHLETWLESNAGLTTPFLFGIDGEEDPIRLNKSVSNFLKNNIFDNPAFVRVRAGLLGTHSYRKFASTLARRNGCSRDDVDSRGRWRKSI